MKDISVDFYSEFSKTIDNRRFLRERGDRFYKNGLRPASRGVMRKDRWDPSIVFSALS